MRKYILGTFALALVTTVVFAFALPTKQTAKVEAEKKAEASQATYVWFLLPPGANINCNSGTVLPTSVTPHPRSTDNPLADMEVFTVTQEQAIIDYNCQQGNFVCAVGYSVNAANFTPSGSTWIPSGTAQIQAKLCRTTP